MLKSKSPVKLRDLHLALEALEERTVPSRLSNDLIVAGRTLTADASHQVNGTVGLFTDPDAKTTQGTFTANIDWGDGQTSAGQITANTDGSYSVAGTHTYSTPGFFEYTIHVSDTDGDHASDDGHVIVSPRTGDLIAVGQSITTAVGQQFNGTVASFVDPDAGNTQGTFTATINWGDGNTSAGTVTANSDGSFTVTGTNTYAIAGFYQISVQISDTDGDSDTAHGHALVTNNSGDLVASGKDIAANATQSFTGTVATFTDPDASNTQGTLSATISWGDGQTSAAQVSAGMNGAYSVTGTHTYSAMGVYSLKVQISDTDGDSDTTRSVALVSPAGGDMFAIGRVFRTDAGQQISGTVAFGVDPDFLSTQGTITASVNWGDGQTSTSTVKMLTPFAFTVSDSHTYASAGIYNYTVTITDTDGDTATAHGRVFVGTTGDDMIAEGRNVKINAGKQFSGAVATFTDPDASNTQGTLSATINWGDGQTSAGQITTNADGTSSVTGTHTFSNAGLYTISISISDTDGDSANATGHAFVTGTNGDLKATGQTIKAAAANSFSGQVATFVDPDSSTTQGTQTATIDWGDGQTSTGTISTTSNGFSVSGTHTYATPGVYQYTVVISDTDGDTDIAVGRAIISPSSGDLVAAGRSVNASTTTAFNGSVAVFTDPDPSATQGTFTATIDWGDGSTSSGQVTTGPHGIFSVTGTHTYAAPGLFTLTISITDSDGDTGSATGYASVAGTQGDLNAVARALTASAGVSFSGPIAYVTDPDASNTQGTITAQINWGDGQTSAGTLTQNADGTFTVDGTHTYSDRGLLRYSVVVTDSDGDSNVANGAFLVTGPGVRMAVGGKGSSESAFLVDDKDDLFERVGNKWIQLGAFIQSITTGSDTSGNPVLFAVTDNNDLFRFDAHGWAKLGAFIDSVSASTDNSGNTTLFAVTLGRDLFSLNGNGWKQLGSFINSVNVTTDASGGAQVFAITMGQDLFHFSAQAGWNLLGKYISSVSATTDASGNQVLFAVTTAHDLFRLNGAGWGKLGSFIQSVSAGTDLNGQAQAVVTTTGNSTFKANAMGLWSALNAPKASTAITALTSDRVFSQSHDGSVYEFQDSTGWISLGTP
jgi:hypothetical protein